MTARPLPQARADLLAARLAPLPAPEGGGWLGAARAAALARLDAMGLPQRRDEYWRYTDPATLNAPEPPRAALFDTGGEPPIFGAVDRLRFVFVDGVFDPAQSDDPVMAGVEILRLAEAGATQIHWARDLYGVLEAESQSPVPRPFAALNTACATDGMLIRVTGRADRPVSLIYRHRSETSDAILHHCIKLEAQASLTVIENGPAAARFCSEMEVDVGEGAVFDHVRAQGRDHERRAVTHLLARVARGGKLRSFTLTANGRLTRNETWLHLAGSDAVAHVAGAVLGDGDFVHDDTVFVTHGAPGCESRQVFKKVLKNGAVGVFQGKILVRPVAQKTDGYQISQALLLDEDSQFLAKPELEIYADDVRCSHGSTTGAIDATALYYLRSRGIPLREAQSLLVLAFLAEALDEIADEGLRTLVRERLEGWLARRGA
jgi:Fe-S cluster assembly protein SufD